MSTPVRMRARRYPKPGLVWYRTCDEMPEGVGAAPLEGIATCFDVSRTGLGFVSSDQLPPNSRVLVHLRGRDLELTGIMRVARAVPLTGGRWEIGVHFEILPPDHRAMLDRIFR